MNTQAEVERIRALCAAYTSGSEWLENPEALKALGAEAETLLAIIDAQQAVIEAAYEMREYITLRDVYTIDGSVASAEEKLKRWDDALAGLEGNGEGA